MTDAPESGNGSGDDARPWVRYNEDQGAFGEGRIWKVHQDECPPIAKQNDKERILCARAANDLYTVSYLL